MALGTQLQELVPKAGFVRSAGRKITVQTDMCVHCQTCPVFIHVEDVNGLGMLKKCFQFIE